MSVLFTTKCGHVYKLWHDGYRLYSRKVSGLPINDDGGQSCVYEWKHSDSFHATEISEEILARAFPGQDLSEDSKTIKVYDPSGKEIASLVVPESVRLEDLRVEAVIPTGSTVAEIKMSWAEIPSDIRP